MSRALSGGMVRKLARALAFRPSLLLLDEPTSAQDLGHQHGVLSMLGELAAEEHYLVLAILHDLNQVLRINVSPDHMDRYADVAAYAPNLDLPTAFHATPLMDDGRLVAVLVGSLPLEDQAEVFKRSLTLGGRLFLVLGEAPVMQAVLVTRVGQDQYTLESLFETELPALRNARRPERFAF